MRVLAAALVLLVSFAIACGGSDADYWGVGAECENSEQCSEEDQSCLLQFKGGYCGIVDCEHDIDCPEDSACIAHTDGTNYCFRTCVDKAECNANRSEENWSNCSSSVTFVDDDLGRKACVPPSSGS